MCGSRRTEAECPLGNEERRQRREDGKTRRVAKEVIRGGRSKDQVATVVTSKRSSFFVSERIIPQSSPLQLPISAAGVHNHISNRLVAIYFMETLVVRGTPMDVRVFFTLESLKIPSFFLSHTQSSNRLDEDHLPGVKRRSSVVEPFLPVVNIANSKSPR